MKNPFLRHFHHAILYYIVSVTRIWKEARLNRTHHKNDWTDLTMALYVGRRDVLVPKDEIVASGIQDDRSRRAGCFRGRTCERAAQT
jgi:hypothetical protein